MTFHFLIFVGTLTDVYGKVFHRVGFYVHNLVLYTSGVKGNE